MPVFIELHTHLNKTPIWINIDYIISIQNNTIETTISNYWIAESAQEIFDKIKEAYM